MMTKQPVPSLIIKLGIPTMISMFVTTIYNMADSYFVGQINTSASGATGVVLGLMAILQAVGFMFGHGSGSIISRKLGQKDIESARKFSATGFYSALFAGFFFLIFGSLFLTPLMTLLGSTPTILPYAKTYGICILCAAPALVSSCVMNNILRYEGRAFFAMIGLTSGGILNIFLDAIFMQKMGMGIFGAGLATAISQYVSWILLLTMFILKKTQTSLNIKYAKFNISTLGDIITTGLPSLARQGLASISTMVLNNAAGVYGTLFIVLRYLHAPLSRNDGPWYRSGLPAYRGIQLRCEEIFPRPSGLLLYALFWNIASRLRICGSPAECRLMHPDIQRRSGGNSHRHSGFAGAVRGAFFRALPGMQQHDVPEYRL